MSLAQTREWNNYSLGFNYYRVNGVKVTFLPVESEINNANVRYLGGFSATSTADADTINADHWT